MATYDFKQIFAVYAKLLFKGFKTLLKTLLCKFFLYVFANFKYNFKFIFILVVHISSVKFLFNLFICSKI